MELIKSPDEALAHTRNILLGLKSDVWVIPQSGGKDSRTAAQAPLVLVERGEVPPPRRIVLYMADTLMEFWTFKVQAEQSLKEMTDKAKSLGIQAEWFMTIPRPQDDFWVKILGYGHIPPTPNMRWCTDRLKVQPARTRLRQMGLNQAPVFLGVRYGESERRDKILSCTLGGECGPDYLANKLDNAVKVQPIVNWRQCAVWDFLTLIAPGYGYDNRGLAAHYGPDGSLRYGCWSCPLIFDDPTARFLAKNNPILHRLIIWVNDHLRRGGSAWDPANREIFQVDEKADYKDGRLSLAYCRRLYQELMQMSAHFGVPLLTDWQKEAVQMAWKWRESLPKGQAALPGQLTFDLQVSAPLPALHISAVPFKTAAVLAEVGLRRDSYHDAIQHDARRLVDLDGGERWRYVGAVSQATLWENTDNEKRVYVYPDGKIW